MLTIAAAARRDAIRLLLLHLLSPEEASIWSIDKEAWSDDLLLGILHMRATILL